MWGLQHGIRGSKTHVLGNGEGTRLGSKPRAFGAQSPSIRGSESRAPGAREQTRSGFQRTDVGAAKHSYPGFKARLSWVLSTAIYDSGLKYGLWASKPGYAGLRARLGVPRGAALLPGCAWRPMPDARNLPGCSAAGSPAARGAEGGRRPAARRCPSMGSPESSGGGGPCAERGGARSLGHPSSACRLPGVSRIAVGVRRRVLPLPPAAPPFLCFLFFFSSASAASPPPKNQTVFKNKASERAMARCRVPAPGSVLPAGRERAAVRTGERPPEPPGERSGEEGRFKSGGRNDGKVREELQGGVEE